ncbi:MAG: electron transfer flavoprotein-ubiquinone oxidoreductase [Gammaproteobacteria bacterium]
MPKTQMHYDVVIVGAGPAGLSAAIKIRQLSAEVSVCVVEKGSEVGAHILSGAVLEPRALNELLPDWAAQGAPLQTPVTRDELLFLTQKRQWRIPHGLLPQQLHNQGHYIISLGNLCRWLAKQAESLGVEIYPGFAAAALLFDEAGQVKGVVTGDMGVAKDGSHKPEYSEGVELHAKYTLFAEGCRGSLSEQLMQRFQLRKTCDPQTYGLGIKEIWEVDTAQHQPGLVQHTIGWPLSQSVYGGAFIYHLENLQVSVGLVVGLDYQNPSLDPFQEMQRFKSHPAIRPLFENGRRIAYGARCLNEGGLQSIPQLIFPGGALIGCAAGFLNVAKIKGTHTAMKSGMLAAEAVVYHLQQNPAPLLAQYPIALKQSWVYSELNTVRNFRPSFRYGLALGSLLGGLELKLFKGKLPYTLHHSVEDRAQTAKAATCKTLQYPKPDGKITFDKMSSVFLSNIHYDENQPQHLRIRDPNLENQCYRDYGMPEQNYCPAGVYERVAEKLQINAPNCIQCKACDIKDPLKNITWTVPEGGAGPNYSGM